MGKIERVIIYTLLAVLAVATFTNLGPTQAEDKPGEAALRKVTIVDEEGRARITLGVDTDGSPGLVLYDQDGKYRMNLGVASDGTPGFSLLDQNEKFRTILGVDSDGSQFLWFYDQNGHRRMNLRVASDGTPSLVLYDQNGKTRAALRVSPGGDASLVLGEGNLGGGYISLDDKEGYARTFIARGFITLNDEERNTRAVLGSTDLEVTKTGTKINTSPSSLVLFDKEGNVIWRTPTE